MKLSSGHHKSAMSHRNRSLVNAFNPVPVVEQVLPDRPKIEVQGGS